MSEHGPQWSSTHLVDQWGWWSPRSTWSTAIHSQLHLLTFYGKCGPGRIRVDQEDQGDHNPYWSTRTSFYILLMVCELGMMRDLICLLTRPTSKATVVILFLRNLWYPSALNLSPLVQDRSPKKEIHAMII